MTKQTLASLLGPSKTSETAREKVQDLLQPKTRTVTLSFCLSQGQQILQMCGCGPDVVVEGETVCAEIVRDVPSDSPFQDGMSIDGFKPGDRMWNGESQKWEVWNGS